MDKLEQIYRDVYDLARTTVEFMNSEEFDGSEDFQVGMKSGFMQVLELLEDKYKVQLNWGIME